MILKVEPLNADAFKPFGEVIETAGHEAEWINGGNTRKFGNLALIDSGDSVNAVGHIYISKPVSLPFEIRNLECHPLGTQAFIPLHNRPFPVVVAPAGAPPAKEDVRVFLTNGSQGINLTKGVWHHYQLSLEKESGYLVIDRAGKGNCEDMTLSEPLLLQF